MENLRSLIFFAGVVVSTALGCVAGSSTPDPGPSSGLGGAGGTHVGGSAGAGSGGAPVEIGGRTGTSGVGGSGSGGTGGPSSGSGGGVGVGTGGAGTTGAGGGGAGTGGNASSCPGVPLMPDGGGFIAPASNSIGIRGSWFVYSDCVDLKGVSCAMVKAPLAASSFPNVGGKMCTSGQTSMAAGAWGAGIGLELNDGPPQMPYNTVAHGIKGFCFQLSGPTIPSTSIRVAFPTKNNPDNAYFAPVTTPGPHTVLFTDTAQGSWVTTKTPFEPTMVMLLQMQIPSSLTAPVPWDFCVEGLTAIMQ